MHKLLVTIPCRREVCPPARADEAALHHDRSEYVTGTADPETVRESSLLWYSRVLVSVIFTSSQEASPPACAEARMQDFPGHRTRTETLS